MQDKQDNVIQLAVPVTSEDHAAGPAEAPVTLVVYGDFECPDSYQAHLMVKDIQRQMGDSLRVVFRHFPLVRVHPHAHHAAEATEFAASQGRFWEMHDQLFAHQRRLGDANLKQYAEAVGLDAQPLTQALAAGTYRAAVDEDVAGGTSCGVHRTPILFVNGIGRRGAWDMDELATALERAGG